MRIIDLTHPLHEGIPVYFPWQPSTEIERTASYEANSCEVRRVSVGTHTGTHIDAPSHLFPGTHGIDGYDLSLWFQEAQVLDCTPRMPNEDITAADLEKMKVPEGIGIVIKTGWDRHFGVADFYQTYPPLTVDAAEYLVSRKTQIMAADTPFPLEVKRVFLKSNIPLVTNLNNTAKLSPGRIRLIAAPMLVKGADGAPARVLALLEQESHG